MRDVLAGTTNYSTIIRIVDSTDGTPETGVTSATAGLDLRYRREGAATVALTESDLSALTDAHSDGGMLHIFGGYYRVDLPDAAVAAGATGVWVGGVADGMVVIGEYHQLVAYDPYDAVRLGLTALPNAAADAAGGLPISDAGGLDLDAKIGALTFTVANELDVNILSVSGSGPAADKLESHALLVAPVTFSAGGDFDTAVLNQVDGAAASSTSDIYNGRLLIFNSGTLNYQAAKITDYDGSTKTAILTPKLSDIPGVSHTAMMI